MIQVSVYANNILTNQGSFASQEEAEAWVAYHQFSGDVRIEDVSAKHAQQAINAEAQAFLSECDWKRQRHISQKALGIATSLSDEEYLAMEQECQEARDRIVK